MKKVQKVNQDEELIIYDKYHSNLKNGKEAKFITVYNKKTFDSSREYKLNKILFTAYNWFMLFMMGLGLGLVSMYFGAAYYELPMFLSYFKVDYLVLLNVFPVVFCLFLLYFIFNRVWISFLFSSVLILGLTWINYFKLLIRNDPLLAMDINLLFESMDMAGKYEIQMDWKIIAVIIACVIGTAASFLWVKGKIQSVKLRLIGIAILLLVGVYSFNNIYMNSNLYTSRENFDLINRWSGTQLHISKGFLYPFIYSFKFSIDQAPKGYDEKAAKEMLFAHDYSDIADNKKVNVISIMLEAYNDFSKFENIEFDKDVYSYWHQLEKESYSGELVTNIFAGNTVDTERSFLTGYTSLFNFRNNINSYVHYFKEQGYKVEGSHPCYDWFYNRKNINKYLGFENYYFYENYYSELANGQIANDNILFPQIVKLYEANKITGQPYFSFNVTYQNHGPYPTDGLTNGEYVKSNGFTFGENNILNNYLAGINSTNQELKALIDHFRNEEEPVVIILFGDHNPWLGDNNSVYKALGINFDLSSQEGFYNYYNTPYIIWGNDSAKETLGNDFKGEGRTIGPYFLMNEFFELADYKGNEFMKVSNELRELADVVHSVNRYKEKSVLTTKLSSKAEKQLDNFLKIQYYWRSNFKKF